MLAWAFVLLAATASTSLAAPAPVPAADFSLSSRTFRSFGNGGSATSGNSGSANGGSAFDFVSGLFGGSCKHTSSP